MKPTDLSNAERLALELGHAGRNAIVYIDEDRNADRPITLNTYRPYGYTPDRPVVLVQHGVLRNGDEYRDFWVPAADKHKLLIVAPTYSNEVWPGIPSYNDGNVYTPAGNPRHVDGWGYALPARVVADLVQAGLIDGGNTYLFGHSAGAQFVHRLMGSQSHAPWRKVAIGNAGWYTLPTMDQKFPDGLGGVGLTEANLEKLLAYPMMIMAGDRDIEVGEHLPQHPTAMAQGPMRYARAHFYHDYGHAEAKRRGIPCNWTLQTVPGVGHDGRAMSAVCASLWFEDRMPPDEEIAKLVSPHVA